MADSSLETAGVADRYAAALFDLALDAGQIEQVERDVDALSAALDDSADLRGVVESPLYPRDQQRAAIVAVAEAMGLSDLTKNTLAVMASKRRLFVTREVITRFRGRVADHRGETTAQVTTAHAMSDTQRDALAQALKNVVGRDVALDVKVDESLIGGLIVKVGSKMIDTSIRSQLNRLQHTMKEAG